MAKLDLGGREVRYDANKKYLTVGVMGSCGGNVYGSYERTSQMLKHVAKRVRDGKRDRNEIRIVADNLLWEIDMIGTLFKDKGLTLDYLSRPYTRDLVLQEEDKEGYLNAVSLNKRILSGIKGIIKDQQMQGMYTVEERIKEMRKQKIKAS